MRRVQSLLLATTMSLSATVVTVHNGWNMLGHSMNVNLKETFSNHPDITLVWNFDNENKNWSIYGNSDKYRDIISGSIYPTVDVVNRDMGYWVFNSGDTQDVEIVSITLPPEVPNLSPLTLQRVGRYSTDQEGGSEISAFDSETQQLFITNGANNRVDVLSLYDVTNPTLLTTEDLSPYGAGVQSVSVKNGVVAVAVGSSSKSETKGKVVLFDINGTKLSEIEVGYLPDMVTFNEDGTKVLVANEGEPDASTGTYINVAGSIGVINISDYSYSEVDFSNISLSNAEDGTEVRLGGTPSDSQALDIEPEYITVVGDRAYVTLQENNAIATLDISGATPILTSVKSLGRKSYSSENVIDIEEEEEILMKNYPNLYGLYQPDTIASYSLNGTTYLVTANEGDGREYCSATDPDCDNPIFIDESKISKLDLDPSIADAYSDENDLKVMVDLGDIDNDGDYDELYGYGARSFSIWSENGDLIWDSGSEFSKVIAENEPQLFNQDDGEVDGRSGNKGVEPEALAVGQIDDKVYAFIGLERQSGIMIYDITDANSPKYINYIPTHGDGDISPEGMVFVPSAQSPNGKDLLIVSYEMSGSTAIYEIKN